jgi:hypothetical protein
MHVRANQSFYDARVVFAEGVMGSRSSTAAGLLALWVISFAGCVRDSGLDQLTSTCASVCDKGTQCRVVSAFTIDACRARCVQVLADKAKCAELPTDQQATRLQGCLGMACEGFAACQANLCGGGSTGAVGAPGIAGAAGMGVADAGASGMGVAGAGAAGAAGGPPSNAGAGAGAAPAADAGSRNAADADSSTCEMACVKADQCCMALGQTNCTFANQCAQSTNPSQRLRACNTLLALFGGSQPACQ